MQRNESLAGSILIIPLFTDAAMKQKQKYFSKNYRESGERKQRRKKVKVIWRYCYCQPNSLGTRVISPLYIHQRKKKVSELLVFGGSEEAGTVTLQSVKSQD